MSSPLAVDPVVDPAAEPAVPMETVSVSVSETVTETVTVETVTETETETETETVKEVPAAPAASEAPAVVAAVDVAAAMATMRAQVEAEFQAKMAATQAELAQVSARLAAEVEAKEIRDVVAEVSVAFANLPGKADDLGLAVRAMRKASPHAASVIEAALKSANSLLGQTLEPLGRGAAGESLTPEQEVARLAKAKREANPTLTAEQARSMVYTENPKLTAAVRGEEV